MDCRTGVSFAAEIQIVENEFKAIRESTVEFYDRAVLEALAAGIPKDEMIIRETTETLGGRKFKYSIEISRRKQ